VSDTTIVILIQVGILVGVLCLFAPGRKLVWSVVAAISGIGGKLFLVLVNWCQAGAVHVYRGHVVVLRNLRPRGTVLPTVARKSTRRD